MHCTALQVSMRERERERDTYIYIYIHIYIYIYIYVSINLIVRLLLRCKSAGVGDLAHVISARPLTSASVPMYIYIYI